MFNSDGPVVLHAGRLARNLNVLVDRMKQSTAEAIAQTVAGLAETVIRSVLGSTDSSPPFRTQRPTPGWREPDSGHWRDDPFGIARERQDLLAGEDWEGAHGGEPVFQEEEVRPARPRWLSAILVALHAAVCWLRSQPGRTPLAALSVGLAAGVAALALGGMSPLVVLLGLFDLMLAGVAILRPA